MTGYDDFHFFGTSAVAVQFCENGSDVGDNWKTVKHCTNFEDAYAYVWSVCVQKPEDTKKYRVVGYFEFFTRNEPANYP